MINLLKQNVKNRTWWVSIISLLILLAQKFGFDLTQYIGGSNWQDSLNTIFSILVLLGVSVNTTIQTIGIGNTSNTTSNVTENAIETDSNSTNLNIANSSNSTNATTRTDNSASAKIKVDNPN